MRLLDNRTLLVYVVVILVVIKFILFPWFDWQNEKVVTINKAERQINKGLMLVAQDIELNKNLDELIASNQRNLTQIASVQETALSYQLSVQKELENQIKSFELSTRSVSWLTPIQRDGLEEHRIEVSLSGSMKGFIQLMLAIEKIQPKLTITEFRSNISKMHIGRKKLGEFVGKIVITGWRQPSELSNEE